MEEDKDLNHSKESFKTGIPVFLPVLPLRNVVALPKSIIPVVVGRAMSVKAVDAAMVANQQVFLTAQRSGDVESPVIDDLYVYGTRAHILQVARMANGTMKILVEGVCRARLMHAVETDGYIGVMVEDLIVIPVESESDAAALWRNLFSLFKEYIKHNEKLTSDVLSLFKGPEDLDYLTDTIAVQMNLDFDERQNLLEMTDLHKRALHLAVLLKKEIEILKAEKKIRKRVQSQVEKNQKDYYLTEQMRAIQRELGREDYQQEIIELREQIQIRKLPKEAAEKVESELKRLEQMQPSSPEASVSRNYIDWIIGLPWHKRSKDTVSIKQAEEILNSTHSSMKKPKERIIEFLAAQKFAKDALKRAPIICLVGPPGVGKTSLAQSVADSLGRTMVRISLGGMRDEAEIRGHRRTYIGAMPGKLIQVMKKAGVMNPLILLDEIDKMSMDFRGDPASALLEVLDPEQNKNFSDNYLEIGYDLSNVLFLTTANVDDNIPYPLLDRMELIQLSGYTLEEKRDIAKRFLLPKLLKEHALEEKQIGLTDTLLVRLIDEYTKEAGVRQLERLLAKLLRKSIQILLGSKKIKHVDITSELVEKWLGAARFKKPDISKEESIGLATGLAWTEVGGDVLEIEVTVLKGKGGLTLTGQLGEVMQESGQAAMSYTRSRAKDLGLKEDFYSDLDIHIHVPEGAIPKDGPSAGITMVTAVVSALTKVPVRNDVAMTGEVSLRGRVIGIGGLKEKLLAATRFGKTTVIVPKDNDKDVLEFQNELDKNLKIIFVKNMDEVLNVAFVRTPFKPFVSKLSKAKGTKTSKTKVAKKSSKK